MSSYQEEPDEICCEHNNEKKSSKIEVKKKVLKVELPSKKKIKGRKKKCGDTKKKMKENNEPGAAKWNLQDEARISMNEKRKCSLAQ